MDDPLWVGVAAGTAALLLRWVKFRRARLDRRRLAESRLLRRFVRFPPPGLAALRATLFAVGVGALAATAAGATAAAPGRSAAAGGPETVLVLDASNSMLAEDVTPSRLERQRELARDLVGRLAGQVAVVYFAGRGYVLSPLTTDLDAVFMFVEAVRPSSVGRGGSALPSGLARSLDVLAGGGGDARKAVVLFSDGEETAGEPLDEALERAKAAGVRIHAVGIGTAEGGPIPLSRDAAFDAGTPFAFPRAGERPHLRGPDGEIVVTRLEEATLRRIAETTGGAYVPADPGGMAALARRLLAADVPAGGPRPARGTTLLLLAGFGLLWSEAFLFRRG